MASIVVLDASAIVAYVRGEPGGSRVDKMLRDPGTTCVAHSMNLCEIYYAITREFDRESAEGVITDLKAIGMTERDDMDGVFWRRVAEIKAGGGISLPDCFCLALAERLGAIAVTSDRSEFGQIGPRVTCVIDFIR